MAKKQFDAKSSVTTTPAAKLQRMEEIQQQMHDMGVSETVKAAAPAPYDEFYKVTTERGFTKITIPKTRG